jgi:hypothetical protein
MTAQRRSRAASVMSARRGPSIPRGSEPLRPAQHLVDARVDLGGGERGTGEYESVLLARELRGDSEVFTGCATDRHRNDRHAFVVKETTSHLAAATTARDNAVATAPEAVDGPSHVDAATPGCRLGLGAVQLALRLNDSHGGAHIHRRVEGHREDRHRLSPMTR